MSNNTMVVDVPKDSEEMDPIQDIQDVTVVITEENGYVVLPDGDVDKPRATFDEVVPEIDAAMAKTSKDVLRIEGHRLADYEAVFKVMALADVRQWKPALAYKK